MLVLAAGFGLLQLTLQLGGGGRGQHPSTSQMRLCPESFTGRAMITRPANDRAAQVSLLTWLLGDGTAAAISKS